MIMLNISHPYPLSGLRNPHRHRVSLACAAKRGSQQPAQQPASLSKKSEELLQAPVVVAAQPSAEKTVAELRQIHSDVDKVMDELSVLKGAARVQRLQMARLVLGPHLDSSSAYERFRHPRLMDRILHDVLRNEQKPIRLKLEHPDFYNEASDFDAVRLEFELDGLTGWRSEVYQGEDDNCWYVEFEE